MQPVVKELTESPTPADALAALAGLPDPVLFDSALQSGRLGRYSFLTADPIASFEIPRATYGLDPFSDVRQYVEQLTDQFEPARIPDLPPFQGGVAGLLSYELGGSWERIPRSLIDEFQLPDAWLGIYDWVLAWDHQQDRAWIIAHGLPSQDSECDDQQLRASRRIADVTERLETLSSSAAAGSTGATAGLPSSASTAISGTAGRASSGTQDSTASIRLAPQFPLPGIDGVTSDFSRSAYLRAVERVIEYIYAGDIFQANLSQRLLAPCKSHPVELYQTLRERNPAPFAGYLAHDDWAVVSASPERFLRVEDGIVETRPIKGTRQRRAAPEADLFTRDELRESEKDVAENVMIVDLLRNDLSRVCEPGSISVPELCVVETYETVQHLVSEIRGRLRTSNTQHRTSDKKQSGHTSEGNDLEPDLSMLNVGRSMFDVHTSSAVWSLLAATFPGGSITGAPKVRAMEIIAEQEPTVRGPYCGSLFYAGFDGTFDSSILIRSFVCRHGWVQCSAGGGIVAQSDPTAEYEETLHKAEGMLRALS